jgi:hypothetical protein
MIESLALDAMLILILLLLVPIGLYRGGLREVCSAAGILLGLLVAQQWADHWGSWVADTTGIDEGVSRFVVALTVLVMFAGLIGYAAASAFSYAPGPGGRIYGGMIALASGVLFLGALIQFVATYLYDGVYPDIIRRGFVSRALSIGFDWVLLIVSAIVLLAIVLGSIVRERETDDLVEPHREPLATIRRPAVVPAMAPEPESLAPAADQAEPSASIPKATAGVKIREVRHWEEQVPPTMQDLQSGWTRTWPSSVTSPSHSQSTRPGSGPRRVRPANPSASRPQSPDEAVIRDWLADDRRDTEPTSRPPRPVEDE